jgi:hypothetical protein
MPHTQLVAYSDIASSIAVILSVFSVLYARHAARAARDQADAARDQAEAATKQLTLEQDRRNEELAQLAEAEREREKRAEIDRSLLAEARLVNFEYDDAPRPQGRLDRCHGQEQVELHDLRSPRSALRRLASPSSGFTFRQDRARSTRRLVYKVPQRPPGK